jgi:uncharacterized membrane protein
MIQLHTSHGWLLPEARHGGYWDAAQFFGGLAAPLFLLLAGAGLGLQWQRTLASAADDLQAETARSVARGVELVVLGYALRLQMWIVDGAAYARVATYPGIALLLLGYGLAYVSTHRSARGEAVAPWAVASALGAILAGLFWAHAVDPLRAEGLIRIDVLQCIGASLMLLSVFGARAARRRPAYCLLLAAAVALATPLLQRCVPGPLPGALAGYLAQWPSAEGQRVVSLFPLFPWLGFAAVGAAVGLAWGRAVRSENLELQLVQLVAFGACTALLSNPSWAPVRWLASYEAFTSLARLTYKAALCCVMIGPALALSFAPKPVLAPIALLGRSSLLVYWVHLQFAFGTVSRPLARSLPISTWATGTIALVACMLALAALRNMRHAVLNRGFWRPRVTG